MIRRCVPPCLLVLCLFASGFADNARSAQQQPKRNNPKRPPNARQQQQPKKAPAKPTDYSQEAAIVEQYHTAMRYENDGTGARDISARIKLQSEAGVERYGQVIVGYSSENERVEIKYVRVLKSDGTVITAPADAVQDLSSPVAREAPVYTDFRQKHITVPGVSVGDTIEYDVNIVLFKALAPGQFWMEHNFIESAIVLDEQLDLNLPKEREVKLKTRPEYKPKITEEGDRKIYHWATSHTAMDTEEEAKKKRRRQEPEQPAVQLTTFPSWEEVGRWYASLERERREPSPEIRAKEEELVKGKTTDMQKVEALYDFVALKFRYISLSFGLGRYQPHSASEVLANQYGDCKDKHTLLASLLEAAGFHASSVLINSSRKIDPDVPAPSQFDHVITFVPVGDDKVWLDTTTEVGPFRLLAYPLRKKQALVIAPDGVAQLIETPANPPMRNRQVQEIDGKLSDLGKLTAHIHYSLRGDPELLMRTLFRRVPSARWQRMMESMTSMAGLQGAEISDLKVSDPADTRSPFTLDCNLAKPNFLDWSKKETQIELPLAQLNIPDFGDSDDDDKTGTEPLKLGPAGDYIYRLTLALPAKYTARAPLAMDMKRDYADYKTSYNVENGIFTAERTLNMQMSELPVARTRDYASFRRAIVADLTQQLAVENASAGTPSISENVKPDELNEAGAAAIDAGHYDTAIELLKRAIKENPQHKAAFNNLGRAYLAERKYDEAAAAFNRQLEVNSYDEFAYNNLGRTYWAQRKYPEAVDAFQKQLNINPLDKFAHENLGSLYLEWHKYDQAVAELEKAISLNSQNPMLYLSLGNAYLNLDQSDKAMSAYDHAVQIAPSPLVWNDIAYELSLKKSHLDQAQRLAESAVASMAAASRNMSLAQLRPQDPMIVNSLASYWDTLGWVYYAQNDFTKAEKYVSSSWVLSQRPEVGDHLGQIYEKLGQKDHALEMYALALNGTRPDPEIRDHLTTLLGNGDKLDKTILQYAPGLGKLRTVKIPNTGKASGVAEFFLLMSPGPKIEDVKFVSGDDKLSSFTEALKTTKVDLSFPDDVPAKILRRGKLTCSGPASDCTFVLYLPEDVRSVQ